MSVFKGVIMQPTTFPLSIFEFSILAFPGVGRYKQDDKRIERSEFHITKTCLLYMKVCLENVVTVRLYVCTDSVDYWLGTMYTENRKTSFTKSQRACELSSVIDYSCLARDNS